MDRRAFFSVVRRGRLRVLELSCERLYLRWVDAWGRTHMAGADEDTALDAGEPPTRIAAESTADLLEELDRRLANADVVRIADRAWLSEAELRRRVDAALTAFERRGGRVEDGRHAPSPTGRALVLVLGLLAVAALRRSPRRRISPRTRFPCRFRAAS
jgi:hypothetical protein